MGFSNVLVSTSQSTLEDRKVVLDCVGMNIANERIRGNSLISRIDILTILSVYYLLAVGEDARTNEIPADMYNGVFSLVAGHSARVRPGLRQ